MEAGANVKREGKENNLLSLIAADPAFHMTEENLSDTMDSYTSFSFESVCSMVRSTNDFFFPFLPLFPCQCGSNSSVLSTPYAAFIYTLISALTDDRCVESGDYFRDTVV